ncbi:MAG: ABC transporter ATP-binding protein [Pseudohongiellaceae bacterium]
MLAVANLNQYYGGSHILRDVSFTVPPGKVTTLLGRNGVGKTTLLRCLMGQVPVRSGSVQFQGEPITNYPSHRRVRAGIGYVPQGREIFPRLTVEENLIMGMASLPRSTRLPERIFELFPVLKKMLRRRGGDLSGGQQQQLAIGRALAMNPSLLILDEPTEGIQPSIIKDIERAIRVVASSRPELDRATKVNEETEEIMVALKKVAQTGEVAILLVEQYYDFARALADQYLVMERGVIIKAGAGQDMERDGVRELLAV